MEYNSNLFECPDDTFVWVICDNYKRYKVAKHCSCCGLWSDEDGNPVYEVTDWKPYSPPVNPALEKNNDGLDPIISALWLELGYDENHIINSMRKHLKVDSLSDCKDTSLKSAYYRYLKYGEEM